MLPVQDISLEGRWAVDVCGLRTSAPAAAVRFAFEGPFVELEMEGAARWKVEIDGEEKPELCTGRRSVYRIAGLWDCAHEIRMAKKTETESGKCQLYAIRANALSAPSRLKKTFRLEFIGDSYTVGFGNAAPDPFSGDALTTTDATLGYGALVAEKLNAEFAINAYSGRGLVQNYMGIAPDWTIPRLLNYTLGGEAPRGNSPIWDFSQYIPDVVCLFVGINDWQGEYAHPQPGNFDSAYSRFLDVLRSHYDSHFLLISTETFPGNYLPERVESVFARELSRGNRDVSHCFLETSRRQGLDFHPDLECHRRMAALLSQKISEILTRRKGF